MMTKVVFADKMLFINLPKFMDFLLVVSTHTYTTKNRRPTTHLIPLESHTRQIKHQLDFNINHIRSVKFFKLIRMPHPFIIHWVHIFQTLISLKEENSFQAPKKYFQDDKKVIQLLFISVSYIRMSNNRTKNTKNKYLSVSQNKKKTWIKFFKVTRIEQCLIRITGLV